MILYFKKLKWRIVHYFNNRKTDKLMAKKLVELLPLLTVPEDNIYKEQLEMVFEYYSKKSGE